MVSTSRLVNFGLRTALFVFSVISLGIEGHLRASTYNTARVNLGIAASTIGLVFSVFAAAALIFIESFFNIVALFVLDLISFTLYLAASASQTAQRGLCHEPGKGKCAEYKTGFAFLYMDWIILFFILVLQIYQLVVEGTAYGSSGRRSSPYDDKVRRPGTGLPTHVDQSGFADQAVPEPGQTHVVDPPTTTQVQQTTTTTGPIAQA